MGRGGAARLSPLAPLSHRGPRTIPWYNPILSEPWHLIGLGQVREGVTGGPIGGEGLRELGSFSPESARTRAQPPHVANTLRSVPPIKPLQSPLHAPGCPTINVQR